jgi:hypothetical protein
MRDLRGTDELAQNLNSRDTGVSKRAVQPPKIVDMLEALAQLRVNSHACIPSDLDVGQNRWGPGPGKSDGRLLPAAQDSLKVFCDCQTDFFSPRMRHDLNPDRHAVVARTTSDHRGRPACHVESGSIRESLH